MSNEINATGYREHTANGWKDVVAPVNQKEVDLTKLKIGDTVVLRCGGRFVVENIRETNMSRIIELNNDICWFTDGKIGIPPSALDIIAIEPAPEKKNVERYFAFYWEDGKGVIDSAWEHSNYIDADKYFKITITEGKPATIEECE